MQSQYTGHIVPAEWRWVVLIGSILIITAFMPFIYVALSGGGGPQWQFMGILHDYPDGATYLAKILQGEQGEWLAHFGHTPEPHNGMFIQLIYLLLGRVAGLIAISPIFVFHIARLGATLIMYLAIYQLGASIWTRIRTRRLFFVLASLGSGFGWLFALFTGQTNYPDLLLSEMFPFQGALVNVHFPLGIACVALLVSIIIITFRPGAHDDPTMNNGAPVAAALSVALVAVYPEMFVVLGSALCVYVAVLCIRQRQAVMWAIRWLMVIVLPAMPILIISVAFMAYNPAMAEWNRQNITPAPDPLALIIGLGLPLIVACPGIFRALRRFEPDGDQFMLVWLLVMLVALYLPTNFQRRFAAGMLLPLIYFAARSLEDFWFSLVNRSWRYRLFLMAMPLMLLSHLFVLFAPVVPIMTNTPSRLSGMFLQPDYVAAFEWLDDHARATDVVLTSPNVGTWLPAWMTARVVYGHRAETLDAAEKRRAVLDWYAMPESDACDALLDGTYTFSQMYPVRYVLVGPQERALGSAACADRLEFIASFGSVNIYVP